MSLIRRASNFVFLAALYCFCLGFDKFALQTKEGGNEGIKSKKAAIKCCKENKIAAPPNVWRIFFVQYNLAVVAWVIRAFCNIAKSPT